MSDEIDITLTCCNKHCDRDAVWCIMSFHDQPTGHFVRYTCSWHIVENLARSVPNEVKYLGTTYGDRDGTLINLKYEYDCKLIS